MRLQIIRIFINFAYNFQATFSGPFNTRFLIINSSDYKNISSEMNLSIHLNCLAPFFFTNYTKFILNRPTILVI